MKIPYPLVVELPNADPLAGKSGARPFHVLAIGKGNSDEFPYTVANEKIASELGRIIGLPLPEILLYRVGRGFDDVFTLRFFQKLW